MLVLEQRLSARHVSRGVVLRARLVHGVEARGWRMKFSLLKAEVEIEADPETYIEIARRLKAANISVRPSRLRLPASPKLNSPVLVNKPVLSQPTLISSTTRMKPLYSPDNGEMKVATPSCHSPGAILPDLPQNSEDVDKLQGGGLWAGACAADTQAWLAGQRFAPHAATFANFCGADLLRLSRDDLIQICGLADGIRLYNALHAKRIEPRLTVYVCGDGGVYTALYLHSCAAAELLRKLRALCLVAKDCETVLVAGPNGAKVKLTDELVRHLPDCSTYRLHQLDSALLLSPTAH